MTNQGINEAVARKLGWVQCCNPNTLENEKIVDCFGWSKGGSHFHKCLPNYCTDICAAWEICEKIKNDVLLTIWWHDGQWQCDIEYSSKTIETHAATAPMAICLALLNLDEDLTKK